VEIEKPGAIEHDGKGWEFVEYRAAKKGEHYLYEDQNGLGYADEDHRNIYLHWIASEIPRATPEQLRAIGMHEGNGGRPVVCKQFDVVWCGIIGDIGWKINHATDKLIGKYRFILVPDVQKEIHTSCEGCASEPQNRWCRNCYSPGLDAERENYTPKQPPRPEEPRFSVGECKDYINNLLKRHVMLFTANDLIVDPECGIKAFTERRRE
jgi:hypothetical protein